MFLKNQSQEQISRYTNLLTKVGALSNLFSDSDVPYIASRATENIFCKAFEANNHSRSDTSADAAKDQLGIGIKTYVNGKGNSLQKIAEFNKKRDGYLSLDDPLFIVREIGRLRNLRLDTTKSLHKVNGLIYHCIAREANLLKLFEEKMDYISVDNINLKKINKDEKNNFTSISFNDGLNEYNFNFSKSTLFKRFQTRNELVVPVEILEDPFEYLEKFNIIIGFEERQKERIFLPLYSEKSGLLYVPEKSGLNMWNAGGRPRDEKEVYIRVPLWIHRVYKNFFPPREKTFNLKLPNGEIISAKICQEGGKALMSNPNTKLGDWLIDEVLKIKSGDIVTYNLLLEIGIDSVQITKIDEENFEIDFKQVGTFEDFQKLKSDKSDFQDGE
jgi:hypothetical protein